MTTRRLSTLPRWCSSLVASALLLCGLSNTVLADKSIFCGAADQLKKIQIIPVAQMDNEMLYESVASILDANMSSEQRLLNHYWMMIEDPRTLSGGKAVSKILALSFTTYYDASWHTLDLGGADPQAEEHTALLGLFGDYKVRVSRDSVQMGFVRRF